MTKEDPWFFQVRAEAFASLMLTERHNVKVQSYAGRDMAIDLLAEILKGGKSTLRFFGVQLIPYMDLPDIQNADERLLSHLRTIPLEAPFPICVFVIGVRKLEGVYRWAVEPVVEDGRALLHRNAEGIWKTLNEAGAASLVSQVSAWYDALNGDSPSATRGRHSKLEK